MARVDGSGKMVTEARAVSNVHGVDLNSFGDVEITQDGSEALTVTGDDNVVPLVETSVDSSGVLHLRFKTHDEIHTSHKLLFKLSVKSLDHLMLNGSGNVHAKELKVDGAGSLDLSLAGSGNVSLDRLQAGSLKTSIAGSGSVKLAGEVPEQQIDIAGSGDYTASDLKSKKADVSVRGSGDVELWATDTLNAKVEGSGDISYRGKPNLQKQVHGSGEVEPLSGKE